MKLILSCLLLAAAVLFTFGNEEKALKTKKYLPRDGTYNNVVEINGESFYIPIGLYEWDTGNALCNLMGMQLVTLDTQERWEMIRNFYLDNEVYDYWTWTSGERLAREEEFKWTSTGDNFTFTSWYPGKPSRSTTLRSCVHFIGSGAGGISGWYDDDCDDIWRVMCEARNV